MRWAYKTIHYGLKKDGLLGGTFLDENEIEESLNEYGEFGWELVSLLEVRDGVIAVFKTSIDESQEHHAPITSELNKDTDGFSEDFELELEEESCHTETVDKADTSSVDDRGIEVEADTDETEKRDLGRDIGSIRIE